MFKGDLRKFSADQAAMVAMLQKAMRMELAAVLQYWHFRNVLVGPLNKPLKEVIDEIADMEAHHAEEFAEWIVVFGGVPPCVPEPFDADVSDVQGVLRKILMAEEDAIEFYTEILELAEKMGHKGLVLFLEHIIEEEQAHENRMQVALRACCVGVAKAASIPGDHLRYKPRGGEGGWRAEKFDGDPSIGRIVDDRRWSDVRMVAEYGNGADALIYKDNVREHAYGKVGPLALNYLDEKDAGSPSSATTINRKVRKQEIQKTKEELELEHSTRNQAERAILKEKKSR